jgi:hypothetical protein
MLEDRSEGRSRVLDVQIDAASEESLVADERAAKVEAALHGDLCRVLDPTREDLAEEALLGEVLRADNKRTTLTAAAM